MFPERLTRGYQSFLEGRFPGERARYQQLTENGQKPEVLLIGCCDSRVSPEVIFDAGPGELFVVRNVANLVPPCENDSESYHGTSAAIEFAVQALKVKHIVVMGHAHCGGIRAFHEKAAPLSSGAFITRWMSQIAPVAERLRLGDHSAATDLRRLELAVVEQSLENLMTFPDVRARVEAGDLTLHGAYFGVATGLLYVRDPGTREFVPCLDGINPG